MIYSKRTTEPHHFLTDGLIYDLMDVCQQIEQEPQNIALRYQRIATYCGLERWESMIDESEEIVRIDPTQAPDACAIRGLAHYYLGDYDAALAALAQSIVLNPNDAAPYSIRGDIHAIHAHWEAAISDYSKTIDLAPAIPAALIERARIYYRLGRLTEATADLALAEPLFEHDWEKSKAKAYVFGHSAISHVIPDDDYYLDGPEIDDFNDDWDFNLDVRKLAHDTEEYPINALPTDNHDDWVIPF